METGTQLKNLLLGFLALAMIVGCAKDREYDEVYKEPEVISKGDMALAIDGSLKGEALKKAINEAEPHMYLVSTLGAPREVTSALPHFQGDERMVYLKWEKDGLKIYEKDVDPAFQDNRLNDKPVLSLPGKYLSYKCATDENEKCTGKEEEDTELEWNQKAFFYPDYEKLAEDEVNSLSLVNLDSNCIQLRETKLVNYEARQGLLNIELERTYTTSPDFSCVRMMYYTDTLRNASFSVRYFYSIVKLSDLASKGYEPVLHPDVDRSNFGFFRRELRLSDPVDPTVVREYEYLERFDPRKKVIDYHLSATFNKPENLYLRDATYKAIDRMNQRMREAGVGMQLNLINAPSKAEEKRSGDLRYNSIVLIDEPLSNGLLGYGPAVSDPRTGEILQAHTNMYSGVLKSGVRRSYNHMVAFSKRKPVKPSDSGSSAGGTGTDGEVVKTAKVMKTAIDLATHNHLNKGGALEQFKQLEGMDEYHFDQIESNLRTLKKARRVLETKVAGKNLALQRMLKEQSDRSSGDPVKIDRLKEMYRGGKSLTYYQNKMLYHSENNQYHEDFFSFTSLGKSLMPGISKVPGILESDGSLRPWDNLTDEQKIIVTKLIMVNTYTATLVHELGHNLGLRHNFEGSADKDNFYSPDESKALGFFSQPSYSSIMDYGFSDLNELSTFGKYDLAALRYGYAREVEQQIHVEYKTPGGDIVGEKILDTKFQKVTTPTLIQFQMSLPPAQQAKLPSGVIATITPRLRPFKFCTDHNVGGSHTCNRFDEGTNAVEIIKHFKHRYEDYYYRVNFRDGRSNFDFVDAAMYLFRQQSLFSDMRKILEVQEAYAKILDPMTNGNGFLLMRQGCSEAQLRRIGFCKDINDIRDAVRETADLFLKILKTPDHTCALVRKSDDPATTDVDETKVVARQMRLRDIYERIKFSVSTIPQSCFEPAVVAFIEGLDVEEKNKVTVFAEAGRYYDDIALPGRNVGELDVIGTWSDAVFAMTFLTKRYEPLIIVDEIQSSLADNNYVTDRLINYLGHITMGLPLNERVLFKDKEGKLYDINYQLGNYVIPEQWTFVPNWLFGVHMTSGTEVVKTIVRQANEMNWTLEPKQKDNVRAFHRLIGLTKWRKGTPFNGNIGEHTVEYTGEGDFHFAATKENVLAHTMIEFLNAEKVFSKLGQERAKVVFDNRNPLKGLSEKQIEVYRLADGNKTNLLALRKTINDLGITDPVDPRVPPNLRPVIALHLEDDGLQTLVDKLDANVKDLEDKKFEARERVSELNFLLESMESRLKSLGEELVSLDDEDPRKLQIAETIKNLRGRRAEKSKEVDSSKAEVSAYETALVVLADYIAGGLAERKSLIEKTIELLPIQTRIE